jgi:hypothetical protein
LKIDLGLFSYRTLDGYIAIRVVEGSIDGAEFYGFVVNDVVCMQPFHHKERRWEVCAGTASCYYMDFGSRENAGQDEKMMEWAFAVLHSCNQPRRSFERKKLLPVGALSELVLFRNVNQSRCISWMNHDIIISNYDRVGPNLQPVCIQVKMPSGHSIVAQDAIHICRFGESLRVVL